MLLMFSSSTSPLRVSPDDLINQSTGQKRGEVRGCSERKEARKRGNKKKKRRIEGRGGTDTLSTTPITHLGQYESGEKIRESLHDKIKNVK